MVYNIFLDVNIIVDFFIPEREGHINAKSLIQLAENADVKCFFSESVINNTSYLVRKSIFLKDFIGYMSELFSFVTVLPCFTKTAVNAYHNAKNDLEDAVLYQIALENKMDYFITSDVKDYKKIAHPLLPVVTAKQILNIIK